ncbi:hypothetical protein ACQPWW_22690 [Micromonospora sp. CA-240977]|uniref:hypothetical protein n=1 Tax=Micromonospora sp. CA-240977 TaxID=3239957 RepID=UPI003D903A36
MTRPLGELTGPSTVNRAWDVLDAVIYGVGINGDETLLRQLRTDPRIPAPLRQAATWWLNLPRYIRDSAAH